MSYYKNKHETFESILKEMIELLPSSYNKEVDDTNYYKLLRALSIELADAEIEIKQIKDNAYLETVSPEAMYKNFGKLVALQKDVKWDDEKYRHLIKGVTKSVLKGPTKQSLIEGFKLFTNFKVNIYELFKDSGKLDPTAYFGYNPMFTFALEVEKPVDAYVDQESLIRDANYIINIIKPAHTLTINIITIVGEENYKKYYRIDKVLGKEIQDLFNLKILTKINEKLIQRFFDEARDYSAEYNVDFSEAVDILRIQSNNMSQSDYDQLIREISEKLLQSYNGSATDCTPVRLRTIDDFIEIARERIRGSLEKKYYKELKDEIFSNANASLTKENIHVMILKKQNELIEIWENAGNNRFDKTDEEWYFEGLETLKEEYLRDYIIKELGGKEKLWQECADIVESFREILEKNMENTVPYCGMDQMEVEGSLTNTEGIFGWRHIDYDLQLKTSLNGDYSRIGGARLIGPRYVLNDSSNSDIYWQHRDEIIPRFLNGQKKSFALNYSDLNGNDLLVNDDPTALLQNFGEESHIYVQQPNFENVPTPCDHNTSINVETSENPFETPEDENHSYMYQSLHEFAWFLKGATGFILNDGILNENTTYFSDEPDHVEELHVDWVSEFFKPVQEDNLIDVVFGIMNEEFHQAEDYFNVLMEQEISEATSFLQSSQSNFIEELHVDWVSELYKSPNEESLTEIIFGTNSDEIKKPFTDESHMLIEHEFSEITDFLKEHEAFVVNQSEINGQELLGTGAKPDHVEELHVDWVSELYVKPVDEKIIDIVFGIDSDKLQKPFTDESHMLIEHEFSEKTNFLQSSNGLRLNSGKFGQQLSLRTESDILSVDIEMDNSEHHQLSGYVVDEGRIKMYRIVGGNEVIIRDEAI